MSMEFLANRDLLQSVTSGTGWPAAGYGHPGYAESLSEFGTPFELPRSSGWLLRRSITRNAACDAMGPYPMFACRNADGLTEDIRDLDGRLVSVALVPDPFSSLSEDTLRTAFHHVVPFKTHFVADLAEPIERFTSSSHRSFGRRALRRMTVDVCPDPHAELDTWVGLYDQLIARHSLTGIKRFSRAAFARQLALPGMVMFRAQAEGRTIGMDLWYVHGEVATGHLVAISEEGYALRASYGLKLYLLEYFRDRVRYVNLGGAAGLVTDGSDGLSAFKRGWSNEMRTTFLCGRICDPARYAELWRARGAEQSSYFPAYRAGEF
jgi:hypothetical protein